MRLTKQTNYAVRMLMYCAANGGKLSRIPEIAKAYGVSELFLFKILQPLSRAGLIETVSCGRPDTGMPFHDPQAYGADACYGMSKADLQGHNITQGEPLTKQDIIDVVAYVEVALKGHPKATEADCEAYFGASAGKSCPVYGLK